MIISIIPFGWKVGNSKTSKANYMTLDDKSILTLVLCTFD